MKKISLVVLFSLVSFLTQAQDNLFWKKIDPKELTFTEKAKKVDFKEEDILFQLNYKAVKNELFQSHNESNQKSVEIILPNSKGTFEKFLIIEASNFAPELQSKYPELRSYKGIGVTDKTATVYFSYSPKGIKSMVVRADNETEFIEPYSKKTGVYKVITSKITDANNIPMVCSTEDVSLFSILQSKHFKIKANDKVFRTFRLALSCNAEYTNYFGGTKIDALAGMNASMTRINGILGKDFAVKLEIIANNEELIFLDEVTDPYSDSDKGADNANGAAWNLELQNTLTAKIGNSGYDIGHLLSAAGGGGNAGCIGCICTNPTVNNPYGKGSGWSAPSNNNPEGPNFDIDVFAHEIGHQLGGNHTFSFKVEGTGSNIEPGSGTTIMGYAGVVSPSNLNVQPRSDDYFSVQSITQIQSNLFSKSCSKNTSLNNSPPIINAGLDYNIPKGTAFILKGTGSDVNGDAITYTWEQNNSAVTAIDANSICFPTKIDGPLFRSIKPSSSPIRYMPAQKDVLANTLTTTWESVSDIERTLNFYLTGRDNAISGTSQTNSDDMKVNVSGSIGPFVVTSQTVDNIGWQTGSSQHITWSINGTEAMSGAANVNIKLSTDGGLTFPIVLASNTPNDGSENIIAPNISETNCRLLIEPTANIFYAVNSKVFAVGYAVKSDCNTYTFSTPVNIPDNITTYTTITVNIPDTSSTIIDVNVALSIEHSFMPDVQVEILSPKGTKTVLMRSDCGTNLNVNFDDSGANLNCASTSLQNSRGKEALSIFNGENPANTWTLRFRDISSGDIGKINTAAITICTKTYTPLSTNNLSLSNFAVYPNPNDGSFKVEFSSQSEQDVVISVHDLIGRKVFENKYKKNSSAFNENLQLKNINSGAYILSVVDGNKREEKKIIIKKDK